MGKLLLIATVSLGTLISTISIAAAETGASATRQKDGYTHAVAAQVRDYKRAQAIAAPGPCETSTAEFVRIGEHPSRDFYNRVLAAQVDQYTLQNNAIAPAVEPVMNEQLPSSMAANEALPKGQHDWYNTKVAEQTNTNLRIERAELPSS